MNIIIYTEDFEPITVVDLPIEVLDSAEKRGGVMLSLKHSDSVEPSMIQVDCCKVKWVDGSVKTIYITKDETLALLIKPGWLVGQKSLVKAYRSAIDTLTNKLKKLRSDD